MAMLNWDHALNPTDNHATAARALVTKLGWSGHWFEGGGDEGSSVWVRSGGGTAVTLA